MKNLTTKQNAHLQDLIFNYPGFHKPGYYFYIKNRTEFILDFREYLVKNMNPDQPIVVQPISDMIEHAFNYLQNEAKLDLLPDYKQLINDAIMNLKLLEKENLSMRDESDDNPVKFESNQQIEFQKIINDLNVLFASTRTETVAAFIEMAKQKGIDIPDELFEEFFEA